MGRTAVTDKTSQLTTRRRALLIAGVTLASAFTPGLKRAARGAQSTLEERFNFLSENGNSNCSREFLESIPKMPQSARLQGSCCGPMSLHRYSEQVEGLKVYAAIPEIPPDPYDIEAGLAQRLLAGYDIELTEAQQAVYDAAFRKTDEGGPCCCKCWRWHVLGGMGKLLIKDRGFDAAKTGSMWDRVNGCGGDSHVH